MCIFKELLFAFLLLYQSISLSLTHHVVEDETGVGQLEVFQQAVELPAVQRAPGTVEVISSLRLLPGVVVVLELGRKTETVCVIKKGLDLCWLNEETEAVAALDEKVSPQCQ